MDWWLQNFCSRKMHLEDDAEEKAFVAANTRSRQKTPAAKPAATSTLAPSPGQKRARPDEMPSATSRIGPRPPVYTKGRDVPLDFPLAALPDLVMCQALVHHNIAFSGPCAWFPGVPATLDGGVRLHPVLCHKIRQSRAMICCNLDDGIYMQ